MNTLKEGNKVAYKNKPFELLGIVKSIVKSVGSVDIEKNKGDPKIITEKLENITIFKKPEYKEGTPIYNKTGKLLGKLQKYNSSENSFIMQGFPRSIYLKKNINESPIKTLNNETYNRYEKGTPIYSKNTNDELGLVTITSNINNPDVSVKKSYHYFSSTYRKNKIKKQPEKSQSATLVSSSPPPSSSPSSSSSPSVSATSSSLQTPVQIPVRIKSEKNNIYPVYQKGNNIYHKNTGIKLGKVTTTTNTNKNSTVKYRKNDSTNTNITKNNLMAPEGKYSSLPFVHKKYPIFRKGKHVAYKKNSMKSIGKVDENNIENKKNIKIGQDSKIFTIHKNFIQEFRHLYEKDNLVIKNGKIIGKANSGNNEIKDKVNVKNINNTKSTPISKKNILRINKDYLIKYLDYLSNAEIIFEINNYHFIVKDKKFYLLFPKTILRSHTLYNFIEFLNLNSMLYNNKKKNNLAQEILKNSIPISIITKQEVKYFDKNRNYLNIQKQEFKVKELNVDYNNKELVFTIIDNNGGAVNINENSEISIGKLINDNNIDVDKIVIYNGIEYKVIKVLKNTYKIKNIIQNGPEINVDKKLVILKNAPIITQPTTTKILSSLTKNTIQTVSSLFTTSTGKKLSRYVKKFDNISDFNKKSDKKLYFLKETSSYGSEMIFYMKDLKILTYQQIYNYINPPQQQINPPQQQINPPQQQINPPQPITIPIKTDSQVSINSSDVSPANDIKIGDIVLNNKGNIKEVKRINKNTNSIVFTDNTANDIENIIKVGFIKSTYTQGATKLLEKLTVKSTVKKSKEESEEPDTVII